MRLMPMSESELAWDMFHEGEMGALDNYRRWVAPNMGCEVAQKGFKATVTWERAKKGKTVARLTRTVPRGGIDTRGHRHLRFYIGIDPEVRVRIIVNGKTHRLKGNGEPDHYAVPIGGTRVRSLVLEFDALEDGRGGASLVWIAFLHAQRDKRRLEQAGHYDASWDGLLLPPDESITPRVEIGLLFDNKDLARLRRKARTPTYRPWLTMLNRDVREMMEARPESLIARFACPPLHYTRPPERIGLSGNGGYGGTWSGFERIAFLGLLEKDAEKLRFAARWMLSLAHCQYWYNDFAGELPGSRFHHRAFTEACVTKEVSLALDWAGCALTETGRDVVRDAIARRGLPRIQQDFIDPYTEYIRDMNQGLLFNTGRILGLAALSSTWPRAEYRLAEAEADSWEMFERTFLSDGGTIEGPGYWQATISVAMVGAIALARQRGCSVVKVVPKRICRCPEYPPILASIVRRGRGLRVSDGAGGSVCTGSLAAMLSHAFPGKASRALASFVLRNSEAGGDASLVLIFGPSRLGSGRTIVPEFGVLEKTGHTVVCRKMNGVGRVRLQFYGSAGGHIGHSHEDRGNILLEAGDETILVDRGVGLYTSAIQVSKRPEAHNLLVPDMPDGSVPCQDIGHKNDICPKQSYRNGRFRGAIDTTEAWPKHVTRCRRTVVSDSPGVFVVTDELELRRSLGATLHLHTPLKARRKDGKWVLSGKRVEAVVEPGWPVVDSSFVREDMRIKRPGSLLGHLQLRCEAAGKHRLVTRITVRRKGRE
ncbi:heparinase II/III family protein [Verrucomicrobiota bacterium]